MTIVASLIGVLIGAVFTGLIIWVIGKLGLGLEVDGFGPAYMVALWVAVFNLIATFLWGLIDYELPAGLFGAISQAILTAGFLVVAGDRVKGVRVKGFVGALIAALIIGAITYGIGALAV